MKGSVLLKKIEIRGYTPPTPAGDYVEHKKSLKQKILEKIPNIEELRQKTIGKKLYLDVCFYLNDKTGAEGDSQKDLDNLLNVIFDVLPQYFTDEKNQPVEGLGLIEGKSDYMIFETHVTKQFVGTHEKEGFDIEISERIEDPLVPKSRIGFSKRLDDKIFPKTNSPETRTAKWIAIWGIVASAIFTLAGVLIGIGASFSMLGFSMQTDSLTLNSNQTSPILSDFARRLIENGGNFQQGGYVLIALGAVVVIFAIVREK